MPGTPRLKFALVVRPMSVRSMRLTASANDGLRAAWVPKSFTGAPWLTRSPEPKENPHDESKPVDQPEPVAQAERHLAAARQVEKPATDSEPQESAADDLPPPKLTPEESEVERRAFDRLQQNLSALVEAYGKKFGNELSTDNAREIVSPEYAASREGRTRWSNACLRPAAQLAGHLFREALRHPEPGKPRLVVMTAGGSGAGKTSSLRALAGLMDAQLIYDGNLANRAASMRSIEAAKAAGNDVRIVFVRRNPVVALVNGVLPRAMDERNGRIVTLDAHARLHADAAENFAYLADRYKADPRVGFIALDNSGALREARPISVEEAARTRYTKDELLPQLREALEQEYADGRISEAVYRATLGAFAP